MKPCWYRRDRKWKCGFFHQWSQSYEEFESGPGHFPAAIIEDACTQECHVVFAGHVSFGDDPPGGKSSGDRKPARFEPRLVWVNDPSSLLVQVHPETIEVFNHSHQYICQVRWIDGKMDYTQGGLPLVALEKMFKEST